MSKVMLPGCYEHKTEENIHKKRVYNNKYYNIIEDIRHCQQYYIIPKGEDGTGSSAHHCAGSPSEYQTFPLITTITIYYLPLSYLNAVAPPVSRYNTTTKVFTTFLYNNNMYYTIQRN